MRPLAGLLAMGLAAPVIAGPSVPFPTYETGPQANGSYVVSNGTVINPAGIQVNLGIRVRAKAVALNPNPKIHSAAVLTLGASQAVEVFDTRTGEITQIYLTLGLDPQGSYSGISYSPDGKYLMFSQDSSYVAIANVLPDGTLTDYAHVSVPPDNSFVTCFPNSPIGDYNAPCGTFYTPYTSYPGGVAFAADGKSAYALLNQNNTITKIDLTQKTLAQGAQIRVGNAPHSVVIKGTTAYVSNEGGREATAADFQVLSAGTPIVADRVNGSSETGTVSVVDLNSFQVVDTISQGIGLHPTGMALFGDALLVCNTYSDDISVIDTATNRVMRKIDLSLPIKLPGSTTAAAGGGPNAIAVDAAAGVAYVALYDANAIAVVDLSGSTAKPVLGMIPVAYAPSSVVLDAAAHKLIVANDKGIGTRLSFETDHGVTGYNTHQDNGTVSIIPLPNAATLEDMTARVYQYNHWDLKQNIESAAGGSAAAAPVPIPAKIGDPSLIKHVFLIIRENRTYDQILGDVAAGNGDASLAVFGGADTPNVHNLVTRFPLLDNFYDPSRQSADGHQWIVEAMAPYADDIQSPDWVRSYPGGNAGDALAYQHKGFLFQETAQAGLSTKIYGEYVENEFWPTKLGHPSWAQLYADAQNFEAGKEPTLFYQNAIQVESSVPVVSTHLVKNFPQFDLNVPDQFRVDIWLQDFKKDLKADQVPNLSILWVMDDHTGGPPSANAEQADNDLAVGRIIDIISHSDVWASSAIFIEEDDAQNGVDHVDGHRSPGYIVSPYAVQYGPTDHTYYTQVNMTRTIEQILGLPPLNQFDLVASPMTLDFVKDKAHADFTPWEHVANQVPLDQGVTTAMTTTNKVAGKLAKAWTIAKKQIFAGKSTKPDSEDADTVNHLNWYEATGFTRPYPGETKVRMPSDFKNRMTTHSESELDGD
jgi:YVTN family beta-propeller protein